MHIHAHTDMYTFVDVYIETQRHICTNTQTHTQDRERMAALVGLGSHS